MRKHESDTRGPGPPGPPQSKTVDFPTSAGRVVYRSNNNANTNAGVSYANANNDPSNTNTNIGSRLALKALKLA